MGLQSMPAQKSFGKAEARTTARMEGSLGIASKTFPSSTQNLSSAHDQYNRTVPFLTSSRTYGSWKALTGLLIHAGQSPTRPLR